MPPTVKSTHLVKIAAQSEPCTQLLDVPADLLSIILQNMPLEERLGVCTRVCRSFHTAAVAATNSISTVSIWTQARCDDVIQWLKRHGSGFTALKAQYSSVVFRPCLASLPCPQLTDFNAYKLSLQPGFFTACTGLTRLLLAGCRVAGSPHATSSADGNPLMQLSVLTSLQHLCLGSDSAACSITTPRGTELELPGSLLSRLVQLTYLQLGSQLVQSDEPFQHMSALSILQQLDLSFQFWGQQRVTAAVLTGLQHLQHLTALKLDSAFWPIDLHSILGLRQLQQLGWSGQNFLDAKGCATLLAAIGQQLQLTQLWLYPGRVWSTKSAAAQSALTASSHLQYLGLGGNFPAGAWQHMFPPTRCLPELTHLWLEASEREGGRQELSHGDVHAMVSCCSALTFIRLGSRLAVSSAAPFGALTALRTLSIHASFNDNIPSLAQLTGLQQLALYSNKPGEQVTANGLLQLTVLQQLRNLDLQAASSDLGLATPAAAPHTVFFCTENKLRASQQCCGLGRLIACHSGIVCNAVCQKHYCSVGHFCRPSFHLLHYRRVLC